MLALRNCGQQGRAQEPTTVETLVMYDPKYKLNHRPPPITRLLRYKHFPPPMVGDPEFGRTWKQRCEVIYTSMMARQRGTVPPHKRRGLWFHL